MELRFKTWNFPERKLFTFYLKETFSETLVRMVIRCVHLPRIKAIWLALPEQTFITHIAIFKEHNLIYLRRQTGFCGTRPTYKSSPNLMSQVTQDGALELIHPGVSTGMDRYGYRVYTALATRSMLSAYRNEMYQENAPLENIPVK